MKPIRFEFTDPKGHKDKSFVTLFPIKSLD